MALLPVLFLSAAASAYLVDPRTGNEVAYQDETQNYQTGWQNYQDEAQNYQTGWQNYQDEAQNYQTGWQNYPNRRDNEIPPFETTNTKPRFLSNIDWDNCGSVTDPIQLNSLVAPEEIHLHGSFNLTADLIIRSTLQSPIKVMMTVERYFIFFWVEVPCIDSAFGSCTFKDICALNPFGNSTCPPIFVQNNLPCVCPFQPHEYSVNNIPIDLSHLKIPESLISAWYNIKVQIEDHEGHRLGCYEAMFLLE